MKQHTTNYFNTFIEVSEDCPLSAAESPPSKAPKTATQIEYEILTDYDNRCDNASCRTRDKLNPASVTLSSIHFGMLTVRLTA